MRSRTRSSTASQLAKKSPLSIRRTAIAGSSYVLGVRRDISVGRRCRVASRARAAGDGWPHAISRAGERMCPTRATPARTRPARITTISDQRNPRSRTLDPRQPTACRGSSIMPITTASMIRATENRLRQAGQQRPRNSSTERDEMRHRTRSRPGRCWRRSSRWTSHPRAGGHWRPLEQPGASVSPRPCATDSWLMSISSSVLAAKGAGRFTRVCGAPMGAERREPRRPYQHA